MLHRVKLYGSDSFMAFSPHPEMSFLGMRGGTLRSPAAMWSHAPATIKVRDVLTGGLLKILPRFPHDLG